MLGLNHGQQPASKCFVTHGTLSHIDLNQPPKKNKPFSTILSQGFLQKAEFVLPVEVWEQIHGEVSKVPNPSFSRVHLPLSALVEGDFFNEYIKKGNILMLSEGRPGVDNVFWLREGLLTLSLDRESYERAGIAGKPDGVKGKRGHRARWIVEIDLRLPSMFHGKKGFDRIVYAFKNVLNATVTWVFCNVGSHIPSPDPLDKVFPTRVTVEPEVSQPMSIKIASLNPPVGLDNDPSDFDEFSTELYEWLSLVSLQSPRVSAGDSIDPYLSRYTPPDPPSPTDGPIQVIKVTWQGFLPATWALKTLLHALSASKSRSWFAFSVCGFNPRWSADYRDCTVLRLPGEVREYILWEVAES